MYPGCRNGVDAHERSDADRRREERDRSKWSLPPNRHRRETSREGRSDLSHRQGIGGGWHFRAGDAACSRHDLAGVAIGENSSDGQSGQGQSLDAVRLDAGGRRCWQDENSRLRRRDGGQYRMEAHPKDILLAKPATIAATAKQLDRTNKHPDMPGRPISSASQTPYLLALGIPLRG